MVAVPIPFEIASGLDFPCPTIHDKTKINMEGETGVLESAMLDIDHKDGDHYNNDPSNLQTLTKIEHILKSMKNGDLNGHR